MIPHLNQLETVTIPRGEIIISPTLGPNTIKAEMLAKSKTQALKELATLLAEACSCVNRKEVFAKLKVREQLATTGIGRGLALPHTNLETLKTSCSAFGISRRGVPFDAIDDQPVHFFFALLTPNKWFSEPLKVLACASRLFKDPTVQHRLLHSRNSHELHKVIYEAEST